MTFTQRLGMLEKTATFALRRGNTKRAKEIRLMMLRLLLRQNGM